MPDFAPLIERLSQVEIAPDATNQYAAGDRDNPYNAIRRANLERYFEDVWARQSGIVLIAEARGIAGCGSLVCRWSAAAFCAMACHR